MDVQSASARVLSACRESMIDQEHSHTNASEVFARYASVSSRRFTSSATRLRRNTSIASPPNTGSESARGFQDDERCVNTDLVADDIYNAAAEPTAPTNYEDITPMSREDMVKLFHIGMSSFLPQATVSAFQGLTPILLTILVGDEQHAGTLSSCTAGAGALIALFTTPIMSQLMDMYGRRVFAIVSSIKSVAIAAPMVAAGIIVHQNDGGLYGEELTGGSQTAFKACVGLWFVATFFKTSTFSSQGIVAAGDIFSNAHHRAIGVGVYQAFMTAGAFATFIGSYLPLMTACIVIASIAVVGVVYNFLFFPETCDLSAYSTDATTAPLANEAGQQVTASRRCFYPETEGSEQIKTSAPSRMSRLQLCVSPARGLSEIRKDKPAFIALLVICTYVFSEITAGDVMSFYLVKRLKFAPKDLSYTSMESTAIQVVACSVVVPIIGRFCSCPTVSIVGSIFVATSLALIAMAKEPLLVFIAMGPSALSIICMPALVAVITRKAVSSEQVSLVVNTVMVLSFALSAFAGVGGGILFGLLPESLLFLTFIFSGAFALPMFVLSIYLRVLLLREEKKMLTTSRCPEGEEGKDGIVMTAFPEGVE